MFYYVFISVTHCCGIVLPKRYVKISKIINAKDKKIEKKKKINMNQNCQETNVII